jgi:hypothetical protein
MILKAIIIFFAMVVVDFFYGRYTIATAERKAVPASAWAGGIILINCVVVCEYITSHWLIPVAAVGSMVGTYLSIKTKKQDATVVEPR